MGMIHKVEQTSALVREAHRALLEHLGAITLDPSRASRLPGWTIGHVLTHLARNADSVVRRLEASARGEVVPQYTGGAEGRSHEIELGCSRPYEVQVADLVASCEGLDAHIRKVPDDAWSFKTPSTSGEMQPGLVVLERRQREVIIHHSDLGIGFGPEQWPLSFAEQLVDELLKDVPDRSDPRRLAGWLTDRSGPPSIAPWGESAPNRDPQAT
jgi:maleylpyruvate isomerase